MDKVAVGKGEFLLIPPSLLQLSPNSVIGPMPIIGIDHPPMVNAKNSQPLRKAIRGKELSVLRVMRRIH